VFPVKYGLNVFTRLQFSGALNKIVPSVRLTTRMCTKHPEKHNEFSYNLILGSFIFKFCQHVKFGQNVTKVTDRIHERLNCISVCISTVPR
jgi:hypothetical protein